ncbi:MAG TPA: cyclic nucleotide-binding domain-containing protein [Gammaproteobacteria bacterium]
MTVPSLISQELFELLRHLSIAPFNKLDSTARTQLGEAVRVITLAPGDNYVTRLAGQRIIVLSGQIAMEPYDFALNLGNTRDHIVITREGENRIIAHEKTTLLLADVAFLDTLSSWAELAEYVRESHGEELANRLIHVTRSVAFRCLPLEHVEDALRRMKTRMVKRGETIVKQGDPGDSFYLLWSGKAEVWRTGIYDETPEMVALLSQGDTFGDEALVMGGNRNATVKMVEDGKLLVLDGEYFRELISRPLLREVTPEEAKQLLDDGCVAVDVRYAEEFEDGHIANAIHLPLPELRAHAESVLDKKRKHVVVCLSGKRSKVGAFLLNQRGYDAVAMKEGIPAWPGEIVTGSV